MKSFENLENLPCSAVVLDDDDQIVFRNRMARGCLLPPVGMKRFAQAEKEKLQGNAFFSAKLGSRRFFVLSAGKEKSSSSVRTVFFIEDFGTFCLPLADYLLTCCHESLAEEEKKITACLEGRVSDADLGAYCKRLAVRTKRYREEREAYLRMSATALYRKEKRNCSFSLERHLFYLSLALEKVGCFAKLSFAEDLGAKTSPDALAEILLNLLWFAMIFEGEKNVEIQGERQGNESVLHLIFRDRENLFTVFDSYFSEENKKKNMLRFAFFPPLFSAALLCRAEEIDFSLEKKGDSAIFTLRLPYSALLSDRFFTAKDGTWMQTVTDLVKKMWGDSVC